MVRIIIKYEHEAEKQKFLEFLATGNKIKDISNPHRSGRFYRVYVDIE